MAAKKVRADSVGNETKVPMDEWVEIGVFAAGEGDALGEPLHLKGHHIRSGEQTIPIIVPQEPTRAGIDPYRKLIDRQREDNIVGVVATSANTDGKPCNPMLLIRGPADRARAVAQPSFQGIG